MSKHLHPSTRKSERAWDAAKRTLDKANDALRKAQEAADAAVIVERKARRDYEDNLELDGLCFDERQREARRAILSAMPE